MRLFRPYRVRLSAVLGLILISAGLGMAPPFLLREVLDQAIPQRDTGLLTMLVAGMVAVAVVTGVLGVGQTASPTSSASASCTTCARPSTATSSACRSPSSPARAPARCSRASPTTSAASRTSSRPPRPRSSPTSRRSSPRSSRCSCSTGGWPSSRSSCCRVRRAHAAGRARARRITTDAPARDGRHLDLVEESLSVSGILLGKTMGRSRRAGRPLRGRVGQPGRARGALGAWRAAGSWPRSR